MNKENELILERAEKIYHVKLDHEITMGSTNNRILNSVKSAGVFLLVAAILTLTGCSASAVAAGAAAGAKKETKSLSMEQESMMDSGKE